MNIKSRIVLKNTLIASFYINIFWAFVFTPLTWSMIGELKTDENGITYRETLYSIPAYIHYYNIVGLRQVLWDMLKQIVLGIPYGVAICYLFYRMIKKENICNTNR